MRACAAEIELRVAQPSDLPRVAALRRAVLPPDNPYPYERNILCDDTFNVVAVVDQQVAGFITILIGQADPAGKAFWQRIRPYIGFVGVIPSFQKRGIGSTLISATAHELFSLTDYSHLYLECESELMPFYQRLGFSLVSPVDGEMLFGKNPTNSNLCRLVRSD